MRDPYAATPDNTSPHRDRLLIERLRAAGGPVSGEELAAALGISRVACRKRLGSLAARGYGIVASRRGYELSRDDGLAWWDLDAPGPVHLFDELPSTMDEARTLAIAGSPSGTLVLAQRQSAGRGKSGRAWKSPAGGLYASVILRSALPPARAGTLVLETALILSGLMETSGLPRPGFRWPNDLLFGGAKAGGILVEMGGGIDRADWYAVGVGLNMEPVSVPGRATSSLSEQPGTAPRRAILASALAKGLSSWALAPDADPARWAALVSGFPRAATALMWDGTARTVTATGFDSRGGLACADGMEGLAPGDCLKLTWQGEPS